MVNLDGTLHVSLSGYDPAIGDNFDILDWGSVTGKFDEVILPELVYWKAWNTNALYTSGTLNVVAQSKDTDSDTATDYDEFVADTCYTNSSDYFCVDSLTNTTIWFKSSTEREYTMLGCTNLIVDDWDALVGPRAGVGGDDSMSDVNTNANFYKMKVELP
jgi:hypothetical protein